MGTNATKAKLKYNRSNYRKYEFNVRKDSKLNALLERFKENSDNNMSELVKTCLCDYFKIDRAEADDIFVPHHIDRKSGEHIPNDFLNRFFDDNAER